MKLDSAKINVAWTDYRQDRSIANRNRLATLYMPIIYEMAYKLAANLVDGVDPNDLAQFGSMGLLDAIAKFDPSRGVKFGAFAHRRCHGEMLDGLRRECPFPRQLFGRLRLKDRAIERFISDHHGQPPTPEELVELVGSASAAASAPKSRDIMESNPGEDSPVIRVADPRAIDPAEAAANKDEARHAIAQIKKAQGPRIAGMVEDYFSHNATLQQIADRNRCAKSRVSQIISGAIDPLRRKKFAQVRQVSRNRRKPGRQTG
jgi:RNA polymerase sigma factor for flagellar operon FliA